MLGQAPGLVLQQAQPGDCLIAYPEWWAAALRSGPAWPQGLIGVSSTAPCPAEVSHAAGQRCTGGWFEIYGSTETAGIGWRCAPDQPFRLHSFWRRTPGAEDQIQRLSPDGDWGASRAAPDHLLWIDAQHFRPLARRDGQLQVGGVNVDPERTRAHLLSHPAVREAVVRPVQVAHGLRLKAFVVPQPDARHPDPGSLEAELLAWCRTHLAPAARPVHIRIGAALPRNEMGKLRDWEMAQA